MRAYLPILIVGGIIGTFAILFILAFIIVICLLISELVKTLPEAAVSCSFADEQFTVECLSSKFSMKTMPAKDFPAFPEVDAQESIKIPAARASEIVKKVSKAVSRDESHIILTGINVIAENGNILAESKRFENGIIYADIDLERLECERRRMTTYQTEDRDSHLFVEFAFENTDTEPERVPDRSPFVPSDEERRASRCEETCALRRSFRSRNRNTVSEP